MDRSCGPETKVQRGSATKAHLHCFAHREAFSLPLAVYSPCTPVSFRKEDGLRSPMVQLTPGKERRDYKVGTRRARTAVSAKSFFPFLSLFLTSRRQRSPLGSSLRNIMVLRKTNK
jgi:hypothetical protein